MKVVLNKCFGGARLSEASKDFILKRLPDFDLENDRLPRHHPVLIECIETLGSKASGFHSNLQIVQVDYDKYILTEYDGMESIYNAQELVLDSNNLEYRNLQDRKFDFYYFLNLI